MLRRFGSTLSAAWRGLKTAGVSVARVVGPYEILELAVGAGCYLLAREYLSVAASAGVALIAGGMLACIVNLLMDLTWTKHVEGGRR